MFRNDPDLGAVPIAGQGSLDIAYRTKCGEAVRFDGNFDNLVTFLDDPTLTAFEGRLYRRLDDDTMVPVGTFGRGDVIVKPPAGDWFVLDELALKSEYASVVNVPAYTAKNTKGDDGVITRTITHTVTPKPAKKATPTKAAAKKPAKKAAPKPK